MMCTFHRECVCVSCIYNSMKNKCPQKDKKRSDGFAFVGTFGWSSYGKCYFKTKIKEPKVFLNFFLKLRLVLGFREKAE